MSRHVARLVAAVLVAAAAGLGLSAPAQAATCGTASGVSVVVDFHQLGSVQSACDAGGAGQYAAAQFTDVGHTLTYVQGQAFVCQVDGAPDTQCARTPPANAYWSLWWSDGKSGTWTYASVGATSLKVPEGGYVALSWQQGSAQAPPRVAPRSHAPSPTSQPTSHPTSRPTTRPSPSSTPAPQQGATVGPTSVRTSSTVTGTATPSRSPASTFPVRSHHTQALKATPQGKHTVPPTSTQATRPASATTDSGSGPGLPGWVAPVVVLLLFAAAAAVAVVRRRRSGGP